MEGKIILRSKPYTIIYGSLLASSGFLFGYFISTFNTFYKPFITDIYEIEDGEE